MVQDALEMLEEEPPAASYRSARTMDDEKPKLGDQRPARRPVRAEGENPEAFDIWLQRGLHQLYDSVAKEPIPDELLKLIEQDLSDRTD